MLKAQVFVFALICVHCWLAFMIFCFLFYLFFCCLQLIIVSLLCYVVFDYTLLLCFISVHRHSLTMFCWCLSMALAVFYCCLQAPPCCALLLFVNASLLCYVGVCHCLFVMLVFVIISLVLIDISLLCSIYAR